MTATATTIRVSMSSKPLGSLARGMKVPLSVSWLVENGLARKVASMVLGRRDLIVLEVGETGVAVSWTQDGEQKSESLLFEDHFLLTLSQLLELGFDPGDEALIMSELLK